MMVELKVTLDQSNGSLSVTLNPAQLLGDKVFVYGLMDLAKDAVRDHHAKLAASPIQVVPAGTERALALMPNGKPA